jgi:hypothetical protein
MLRKVCNQLLESSLNHHILTIKHFKITVDREYTYGLPRFRGGAIGHGIQPIRYRMLRGLIPLIYQELTFGSMLIKIIFQRLALSCCKRYQEII